LARRKPQEVSKRRRRPATSPEYREEELASAAYTLAEKQILAGTASSQVITHFLKMGSSRERLEQQRIEHENDLLQVKREAIASQQRIEELYADAISAMRSYGGSEGSEPTIPDEDVED
jgi:dsRNA-specific ribonuclease